MSHFRTALSSLQLWYPARQPSLTLLLYQTSGRRQLLRLKLTACSAGPPVATWLTVRNGFSSTCLDTVDPPSPPLDTVLVFLACSCISYNFCSNFFIISLWSFWRPKQQYWLKLLLANVRDYQLEGILFILDTCRQYCDGHVLQNIHLYLIWGNPLCRWEAHPYQLSSAILEIIWSYIKKIFMLEKLSHNIITEEFVNFNSTEWWWALMAQTMRQYIWYYRYGEDTTLLG